MHSQRWDKAGSSTCVSMARKATESRWIRLRFKKRSTPVVMLAGDGAVAGGDLPQSAAGASHQDQDCSSKAALRCARPTTRPTISARIEPNKFNPFLSGEDLEDVTIAGRGVIDGAGQRWWVDAEAARQKKSGYTLPRPNMIVLTRVTNLVVRDVTLQNSPKFHLVPTECDGVTVSGITILAPSGRPTPTASIRACVAA